MANSYDWEKYEQVATELLNRFSKDFGLSTVEEKQKLSGNRTGTEWEVDAKGIRESDGAIILVECRRYTKSKLNQEQLAAIAYRIFDTGAKGGITVSPFDLEKGARKVSAANDITHVTLNSYSTTSDFILGFLNKLILGVSENINLSVRERVRVRRWDADGNELDTIVVDD